MRRSIFIQSVVAVLAVLAALMRWQSVGPEAQSWVLELFWVKAPHTVLVAGSTTFLVIALGLGLAVLLLRGPKWRLILVPVVVVLNAAPIVMLLRMSNKEQVTQMPFAASVVFLTVTNLLIYFYGLHFFQELFEEVHRPYIVTYRFEGSMALAALREKIGWLALSTVKPVFFAAAGFSLFTDLYFDRSGSGVIGSLFVYLSREAVESSRLFLFLVTAAFFSLLFLVVDLMIVLPVERYLRGHGGDKNAWLVDRWWCFILAGAQGVMRNRTRLRGRRWWIVADADGYRLRWTYGLLAVGMLALAAGDLATLPERSCGRLIQKAYEAPDGVGPAKATLAQVESVAKRAGLISSAGPEIRGVSSLLIESTPDDQLFLQGADGFIEAMRLFAGEPLGGAITMFRQILPVALLVVGISYLLAILEAYRRVANVIWLPSALEAFPFMIWLLIFDQLASRFDDRIFWYMGLGLISLPICYHQATRLIGELTDQNIIYGERMMAWSEWKLLSRLTWFRAIPLLLSQISFVLGFSLLIDSSMNFLRQFSEPTSLPVLIGTLWQRIHGVEVMGHPLILSVYRTIQFEILLVMSFMIAALFLLQRAFAPGQVGGR